MKRKIILALFCGVVSCLFLCSAHCSAHYYSDHTSAGCTKGIEYDKGDPTKNKAIVDACDRWNAPSGAMWINGSGPGVYDVSEGATVIDTGDSSKTVDLYLQGALVFFDNANGTYGDKVISTYNLSLCNDKSGCNDDGKNHVDYITNPAEGITVGSLNRGWMPNADWNWTDNWAKEKIKLTVNLSKFKDGATPGTSIVNDDGAKCFPYSRTIFISRYPSIDGGLNKGLDGMRVIDSSTITINFCEDPLSTYTGTTEIWDGSSKKNNNYKIANIGANSKDIKFVHYIKRDDKGPDGEDAEPYYVNSSDKEKGKGASNEVQSMDFGKNDELKVHEATITTELAPGQTQTIFQTLHYAARSNDTSPNTVPDGTCTLYGSSGIGGRYCVQLSRATASFSGNVAAKIKDGNKDAIDAPADSHSRATTITSDDGSFTIQFKDNIKRESDQAGGTAATSWSANITADSSTVANSNRSGTTIDLETGHNQDVLTYADYSYSGTLKYGETKTICNNLSYAAVVSYTGNTSGNASKCVKVYREKAKCKLDASYQYGISDGRNIGRIGVVNSTIAGGDSFSFTDYDPSNFTANNSYTKSVDIWARPGDSIRFRYESCAGAAYAVFNTSTLDNATNKSVYTATGASSISGRSGYLFGASVPTVTSASPLKYSDTRTWDSSTATSGFLHDKNSVEKTFQSPSNINISSYDRDTYNQKTYKCKNLPHGPTYSSAGQHYQIAGSSTEDGCYAAAKTGAASDVGSTITQSFTWNDLNITGGVVSGVAHDHTAKANVRIPYNYILQPYAKRSVGVSGNVVYGGSSFKVNAGVFVQPRTNTSISDNDSENKYATITKPTKVKIERYFTTIDSSGNIGSTETDLTTISTHTNITFNNNGDHNGLTSGNGDAFPSSGISVYVPDDRPVGSVVCVKYSVWPRDSHNNLAITSGAGLNDIALKSTAEVSGSDGAEWATARACYTVAKRPTTSFEGSNVLAAGNRGFITSRYTRAVSSSSAKNFFGSWSEYALIGKDDVSGTRGTASGATFGYRINSADVTINQARANDVSDVANIGNADSACVFGSQTFSNDDCNSPNIGAIGAQISGATESAKNYTSSIKSRYITNTPTHTVTVGVLGNCNSISSPGDARCVTDAFGTKYAHISSNNHLLASSGSDGILYNKIEGNAYSSSALVAPEQTTVYYVTGTLIIDGDILSANSDQEYNNTKAIKQNIIIAKNVLIMPNVRKIDALIVADNEVDTCAYTTANNLYEDKRTNMANLSSDVCNEQLIFEAPVLTKTIKLNRTFGADSGTNAIKRAEIFNFNMANYLWSYAQSAKYNEASTTNLKELPPRY